MAAEIGKKNAGKFKLVKVEKPKKKSAPEEKPVAKKAKMAGTKAGAKKAKMPSAKKAKMPGAKKVKTPGAKTASKKSSAKMSNTAESMNINDIHNSSFAT